MSLFSAVCSVELLFSTRKEVMIASFKNTAYLPCMVMFTSVAISASQLQTSLTVD